MSSANWYDMVIIGGRHNGLVAATCLARSDKRVVLEKPPVVGGAAISEHPFGPGYRLDERIRAHVLLC